MQMNKGGKSVVAVYAIIAVVFTLVFALIPFPKTAGAWLMFAFSLISIAGSCGITLYTFGKGDSLMSKFYGYPVYKIGVGYMVLQLALSMLVFILGVFVSVPYWVGLVLSVILAGAAGIGVIAADNARDLIEQIDRQEVETTRNVAHFYVEIGDLLDLCQDETLRPAIKELATKCKYSDPVSIPETEEKEAQIKAELQELRELLEQKDFGNAAEKTRKVTNLLASRNRIKSSRS